MKRTLIILLAIQSLIAGAQSFTYLDYNNVAARVQNNGVWFN